MSNNNTTANELFEDELEGGKYLIKQFSAI